MLDVGWTVPAVVLLAGGLILGVLSWTRGGRRGAVAAVARSVGLVPIDDISGLLRRRSRRSLIGVLPGCAIGLGLAAAVAPHPLQARTMLLGLSGALLGGGVGGTLAAASTSGRGLTGPGRRPRARLEDYVAPAERVLAWSAAAVAVGIALAAVVAIVLRPVAGTVEAVPVVLASGVLAAAAVTDFEVRGRRIAARPRTAASDDDAAWDDAMRSLELRGMAANPVWAAVAGAGALAVVLLADGGRSWVFAVYGAWIALRFVQWLLGGLRPNGLDRHYLRRLWPERATRLEEYAALEGTR